MEQQRKRRHRMLADDRITIHQGDAVICIGRHHRREDFAKGRSSAIRPVLALQHQRLRGSERRDAGGQLLGERLNIIGAAAANADETLHDRQQVLDPMPHLAQQQRLLIGMT